MKINNKNDITYMKNGIKLEELRSEVSLSFLQI
jgi:hypothetical protein